MMSVMPATDFYRVHDDNTYEDFVPNNSKDFTEKVHYGKIADDYMILYYILAMEGKAHFKPNLFICHVVTFLLANEFDQVHTTIFLLKHFFCRDCRKY